MVVGRLRVYSFELGKLLAEKFFYFAVPVLFVGLFAQCFCILILNAAAKFVLYHLYLLLQEILFLLLLQFLVGALVNLATKFVMLHLFVQHVKQCVCAVQCALSHEYGVFVGNIGSHIACNEIDEERRFLYVLHRNFYIGKVGHLLYAVQYQCALSAALLNHCFEFGSLFRLLFNAVFYRTNEIGPRLGKIFKFYSLLALQNGCIVAVGHREQALYGCNCTNVVQVVVHRFVGFGLYLAEHAYVAFAFMSILQQPQGGFPSNGDGKNRCGEKNHIAQCENG